MYTSMWGACMYMHTHITVHVWQLENNLVESVLLLYVESRDQTQVTRFLGKCL